MTTARLQAIQRCSSQVFCGRVTASSSIDATAHTGLFMPAYTLTLTITLAALSWWPALTRLTLPLSSRMSGTLRASASGVRSSWLALTSAISSLRAAGQACAMAQVGKCLCTDDATLAGHSRAVWQGGHASCNVSPRAGLAVSPPAL